MLKRLLGLLRRPSEHEEVRRLSSDYLDGDLPNTLMEKVRLHLDKCGPCASFFKSLSSTIRLLSEMGRQEAPANLKSSILERVRRDGERKA